MKDETFSRDDVMKAIRDWLEYGDSQFCETDEERQTFYHRELGHRGYFSHNGWAARCLRWHLMQLGLEGKRQATLQDVGGIMRKGL